MAEQDAGPTGALAWFPWGRQDLPGWRFDVITLLAIIGESSVAEHVQTLTASSYCLLPRIIPAPQALLRPSRPQRLPQVTAKMAGVHSGVVLDTVGFFANIIHPLDEYKAFSFQVLKITHAPPPEKKPDATAATKQTGWMPKLGGGLGSLRRRINTTGSIVSGPHRGGANGIGENPNGKPSVRLTAQSADDPERGIPLSPLNHPSEHLPPPPPPQRAPTIKDRLTTMSNPPEAHTVLPATYSPVHALSVLSFLITIAIIVAAIIWEDGTAILAICFISLAGTVVCYASWWRPVLMKRRAGNTVPPGDVVIRTRVGAFVLIKCTEDVARELYSSTEECQYVSAVWHRVFMGLGMVLLMVAVVLLGNCGWNSQVLIGGSYIALNALYWAMSLLKQRHFWDLTRYVVDDVTPPDTVDADLTTDEGDPERVASFTRTLWYAVRETKKGAWVERSGALPGTDEWKTWLKEAVSNASGDPAKREWEAVKRKNEIMEVTDEPAQRAPLDEIPPPRDSQSQGHSPW